MEELALLCRSAGGNHLQLCRSAQGAVGSPTAVKQCSSKDHLQLWGSAQGDHIQLWVSAQGDHLQLWRNSMHSVTEDGPGWLCLQSCKCKVCADVAVEENRAWDHPW